MSLAALLQATRDTLRSTLSLTAAECDVRPTGQPPPTFGQRYVALHASSWQNNTPTMQSGVDELYGVVATITLRTAAIPIDRLGGEAYLKPLAGVEALCRRVMVAVHQNYDLMALANSFLPDATDKIMQPLFWRATDAQPELRDESWVWANVPENKAPSVCAMSMEVRFSDARRPQSQDTMK